MIDDNRFISPVEKIEEFKHGQFVSVKDLQRAYNDLYVQLRKYIWGFNVVMDIAELETSVYEACPDMDSVARNLTRLSTSIRETQLEDEDLNKAIGDFQELINDSDGYYLKLVTISEVNNANN